MEETPEDHDQRLKSLIREFFADFLWLFFSEWAKRFDLDQIEWLDKEVLPNPPDGSRHLLDLVAKLRTKHENGQQEQMLALIHIEIEAADRTTRLKPRLPSYYVHLRDTHQLPVLPIVIYLKVGLGGIGVDVYEERFWDFEVLRFNYLYVGLPGLDGLQYLAGDNMLGVALSALMKLPPAHIVELGRQAYDRINVSSLNEQQKFLLSECIEAYLPLNEQQRQEFESYLSSEESPGVHAMNKTRFERALQEGIEKGMQNTLIRQGRRRFGPPTTDVETRIRNVLDVPALEHLTERILEVQSWDELLQAEVKP